LATVDITAGCISPPEQLSALRTLYIGFRKAKLKKAKDHMRQCESKDRDFKSYASAVFRHSCCLSASLSTKTIKGTWESASLRATTLREIKENMGQRESKERDFKEFKRSKVLKKDFRSKALENREEKRSNIRVIR
jgi:hypothetical protein